MNKLTNIKHNPNDIVRIAQKGDQVVFLENGNHRAGLEHILSKHGTQFDDQGVKAEDIPDLVMAAVTQDNIVGYHGQGDGRPIYQVSFGSKTYYVAVTVAKNGFIVGANPRSGPS